jgi:ethanolamine utilization cobalamin adenosyltransferase
MKPVEQMEGRPKPEHITHLSGKRLVRKDHARIAFRGAVDSLEAEVIEAQVLASKLGEGWYCEALGEILDCLRKVMAAEVKEQPLPPPRFFGAGLEELHRQSHDVRGTFGIDHPLPDYTMGPLAARLNLLRTKVREAELPAVRAFGPGTDGSERQDLILVMNRLSSVVYWLFCRSVSDTGRK